MSSIERHYRLMTIMERIEQLEAELVVIETGVTMEGDLDGIEIACGYLDKAVRALKPLRLDLQTALILSIEEVKERKRCAQVGSEK